MPIKDRGVRADFRRDAAELGGEAAPDLRRREIQGDAVVLLDQLKNTGVAGEIIRIAGKRQRVARHDTQLVEQGQDIAGGCGIGGAGSVRGHRLAFLDFVLMNEDHPLVVKSYAAGQDDIMQFQTAGANTLPVARAFACSMITRNDAPQRRSGRRESF
jgi:hypothetical protein